MASDDSWVYRLHSQRATGQVGNIQIQDVQVVDTLFEPFDTSTPSMRKGSEFLETIAGIEKDTLHEASTVFMFGCTSHGESVCIRVVDFKPSLYYEVTQAEAIIRSKVAKSARIEPEELVIKMEKRINMYGWVPDTMDNPTQRRRFQYYKVSFPTVKAMRRAAQSAKSFDLYCHEDKVTVDTKFLDEAGLTPSGWLTLDDYSSVNPGERMSHCTFEVVCNMRDLKPTDLPEIAPLLTAFVDIETISASNSFPDATIPEDIICMIGVVFWRVGTPHTTAVKVIFVTPERCGEVDGAHVMRYANEREMLRDFRYHLVVKADPDVIATYNGFGFDLPYIWKRAEMHNLDDFFYMDRIITRKCPAQVKELTSSALGHNDLFIIDMFGRCNLDLYNWIKSNEKLESYKLDSVCEHFLSEKKLDMDYKELFRMSKGTPDEIARVALYCVQDCFLLVLLSIRLQIFASNLEMSRVTHTPMEMLVTRGQQIKVINQLIWHGHRMEQDANCCGYILNTPRQFSGNDTDTYEGATVIDAKAMYYREPIATLDFMSLYPSIILANNFCFSTLVQDMRYANIPGVDYVYIEVNENKKYLWAKNMPGVIPVMMRNLLSARKQAKKMMNEAGKRMDVAKRQMEEHGETPKLKEELERATIEKAVYNARQLALKISANSIYGFTGAVKTGKYHCLAIADCVTFRARQMLHQTVEWVHEYTRQNCEGECDVVYGDTDSVMVKFLGVATVDEAALIAEKAADWITQRFAEQTGTNDIVLEFEKVYFPYLLMKKKRYAGLMFEPDKSGKMVNTKLDCKGIEFVRRDNCLLAKRVQKKVLDALMYKRDPELACAEVQSELDTIINDSVDIMDYKMSKARRKDYVNEDLPHLRVVAKMAERDPGSEPQIGDRVPYVLVVVPHNSKAKTCDKAEDIGYVQAHSDACKIDRLYYVEHQIEKPICGVMEFVIDQPERLFEHCKRQLTLQQNSQGTLDSFFRIVPSKPLDPADIVSSSSKSVSLEDSMFGTSSNTPSRQPAPKKPRRKK